MRIQRLLFLGQLLLATSAFAGPNAGGVLMLHANESLVWSTGADFCGQSQLERCSDADVRVDGTGSTILYLLAAFPPAGSPRLAGVTFGLDYNTMEVAVEQWQMCGDFELPAEHWPLPNCGNAITWSEAQTKHIVEIGWFSAYTYSADPSPIAVVPHECCGSAFADDAVPANLDAIADYGSVGFNTDGYLPCPLVWDCALQLLPSKLAVYQPCGGTFPVELWIHDVEDLGDFSVCVGYDDALLGFSQRVIDPEFLGSTGRPVSPLPADPCDAGCEPTGIRIGAQTGLAGGEGATGSGRLATIFFAPQAAGTAADSMCLGGWSLHDANPPPPDAIFVTGATGISIVHRASCFGDFNGDGNVTVFDLAANIPRWGCRAGDGCYNEMYDVNLLEPGNYCASTPNGLIDVEDIQRVAGRWHLGCPGDAARRGSPISARRTQTLRISPAFQSIEGAPGDTVSVALVADGVTDLGAYEAEVTVLAEALKIVAVVPGSFLQSTGRTSYAFSPQIDAQNGRVQFGSCTVGDTPAVGGSGVLARIRFEILECGSTVPVEIVSSTLTFADGEPQAPPQFIDGSIQVGCAASVPPGSLPGTKILASRPNPLSGRAEIFFRVPGPGGDAVPVDLSIFDVAGRQVRTLVRRDLRPGDHREIWDARDQAGAPVPSGRYFGRLHVGGKVVEERIVVVR